MDRVRFNYWIDILLLISFVISAISGFVLKVGTNRVVWLPWHTISSFVMVLLVLIHLVLHFRWLKVMTVSLFKKKV